MASGVLIAHTGMRPAEFGRLPAHAVGSRAPEPAIVQIASLRVARSVHSATALLSGHVLLVGGMADGGDNGSLASAELFDPGTRRVETLAPLAEPRSGHTATRLADGRVVVAGGFNGAYLASLEIYEPASKRFRAAGSLTEARSGHTATLLPDGRILFVGGVGVGWTFLRSAELYDPRTGRSERVSPMAVSREGHTATLLDDGRVLVVGGHSGRQQHMTVFASAERFDPSLNRFESVGGLATARHKHDAVKLRDGRVLVIGGADRTDRVSYATTEVYQPGKALFARGPSMANTRFKIAGTSAVLPTGDVLVTSGASTAEVLDVDRWSFRKVAGRYPAAYNFAAVAPLPNGDVIVTGGYAFGGQNGSGGLHNTAGVWRIGSR